uniref:Uncharacterized protein n=1 Tax=Oryza rufipogon TaxID=4529 RepID=A0A0E0N720_ORYRU
MELGQKGSKKGRRAIADSRVTHMMGLLARPAAMETEKRAGGAGRPPASGRRAWRRRRSWRRPGLYN